MKTVYLYTDGSCLSNPGPGGWCAILVYGDHEKMISGGESETTNNRMELTAILKGLQALKEPCEVVLTSDSKYALDSLENGWALKWKQNGWKKSKKENALNPDLWDKILCEIEKHSMKYLWVKGHAGHSYNERCDTEAQAQASRYSSK